MPLTAAQIQSRLATGKPFIVGTYLGMNISELMCKVKGNANLKENRVIAKHTVTNSNGIHVYSEFLPPGTIVDKDESGLITKVLLPDRSLKVQQVKSGAEVVVDLFKYARDGVGIDIMGDLHPVVQPETIPPTKTK